LAQFTSEPGKPDHTWKTRTEGRITANVYQRTDVCLLSLQPFPIVPLLDGNSNVDIQKKARAPFYLTFSRLSASKKHEREGKSGAGARALQNLSELRRIPGARSVLECGTKFRFGPATAIGGVLSRTRNDTFDGNYLT